MPSSFCNGLHKGVAMVGSKFLGMVLGLSVLCLSAAPVSHARECGRKCMDQQRRDHFLTQNPDLPEKVKSAILAGKVLLGMSKEEVVAAIGKPQQSVDVNASWAVREQWVYHVQGEPLYYYFKFGSVSGWHKPLAH